MFSHTSEYALRAIIVLAAHYGRRPLRADEVARATGSPRNYMGKTLNSLVKSGLLKSARGPQGGFSLAIPPEKLTLAHIIDCFVEEREHSQCLLGSKLCDKAHPCAAHNRWTSIVSTRREPLSSTTIADLIRGPREIPVSAA